MTPMQARRLARQRLSDERFIHSECVAAAAGTLALRFGADRDRAVTAAWLHDILKEEPKELLLQRMQSSDIMRDEEIIPNDALWHSYAGGIYVLEELCLDREIADAVMYHTAGRSGMSLLEKVIFLSDYISEDRDYRGVDEVRELAEHSLDEACLMALRNAIVHICKLGRHIDINSVRAFNELVGDRSIKLHGKEKERET